jgi:hypothetical protein
MKSASRANCAKTWAVKCVPRSLQKLQIGRQQHAECLHNQFGRNPGADLEQRETETLPTTIVRDDQDGNPGRHMRRLGQLFA